MDRFYAYTITVVRSKRVFIENPEDYRESEETVNSLLRRGVIDLSENIVSRNVAFAGIFDPREEGEEFEVYNKKGKLQPFNVTFARTGNMVVYATNENEALKKAEFLDEHEISWCDGFNATDSQPLKE